MISHGLIKHFFKKRKEKKNRLCQNILQWMSCSEIPTEHSGICILVVHELYNSCGSASSSLSCKNTSQGKVCPWLVCCHPTAPPAASLLLSHLSANHKATQTHRLRLWRQHQTEEFCRQVCSLTSFIALQQEYWRKAFVWLFGRVLSYRHRGSQWEIKVN